MKEYFLNSIVIGGLLPMIFLGVFVLFQKYFSVRISAPAAIIGICTAGILTALFFQAFEEKPLLQEIKNPAFMAALFGGVLWGMAMIFIAWGFGKFSGNISQIIPIVNANALIGVLIAILFFGEQVIVWKVITGAILIFIGTLFLI